MEHTSSKNILYKELQPTKKLENLVHSFWMHYNDSDKAEHKSIIPDSYLKIVFAVKDEKIQKYFLTGLWTHEKTWITPPKTINYGCRLKILAPEFLLQREMASLKQDLHQLDFSFLNLESFDLTSFERIVQQWENELLKIKSVKEIPANKLSLSQLLDKMNGGIKAKDVAEEIYWTNRQINRYLNKYIGVSLKKYLNIQKTYHSYIQIREGRFFPEKYYFDQAHFIREVKKHTGTTPRNLHEGQNDRFIQLKHMKPK